METFDGNKSGKVTWDEFQGKAQDAISEFVKSNGETVTPEKIEADFKEVDTNGDQKIKASELYRFMMNKLPETTSHKSTIADIGAKVGVDLLDLNNDSQIDKEEFKSAVEGLKARTEEPTISAEPTMSVQPTISTEPTMSVEPTISAEPTMSVEPTISTEPTMSVQAPVSVVPTEPEENS